MKLTAQKYAAALFEGLKGKNSSQAKRVIGNFIGVLAVNKDLALAEKIIERLAEIWNKERGVLEAELIAARSLDKKIKNLAVNYLKTKTQVKHIKLIPEIDKNILGGMMIKCGDRILDLTVRTQIDELKKQLVG